MEGLARLTLQLHHQLETLSVDYYGRPANLIDKIKACDGISREGKNSASDGSPDDNIYPYIDGRRGPAAAHIGCTLGSPDVLSREQV